MRIVLVSALVVVVVAVVLLVAKSMREDEAVAGREASAEATDSRLSFAYEARGQSGTIDQTVTIRSGRRRPVAPTLRYTALGADRQPLHDVRVSTVYGSDRGLVVVPPTGALDILVFEPAGDRRRVRDVAVDVVSLDVVQQVGRELVEAVPLAPDGAEVDRHDRFASVELRNPDRRSATVRLVYIVYDVPPAGFSQQAEAVIPVAGPVDVPARGSIRVPIDADVAQQMAAAPQGRPVSLKAYHSR